MSTKAPDSITSTARYARPAADALRDLDMDPPSEFSSAKATRQQRYGDNQLAEAPKEPRWRAFLRQSQDLLIIILLVAAAVPA